MASYVQQETLALDFRPLGEGEENSLPLRKEDVSGESSEIGLEKVN